jgi:hypothetical protein
MATNGDQLKAENILPKKSASESDTLLNHSTGVVKLPGFEIWFPNSWKGSIFGCVIVITIGVTFTLLTDEHKDKVINLFSQQQQEDLSSVAQSNVAPKKVEYELIVENNKMLVAEAIEKDEIIFEYKSKIEELKTALQKVDSTKATENKEFTVLVKQASAIVEKTNEKLDLLEAKKTNPKDAQKITEELVAEYAMQDELRLLVTYFVNKRHWFTRNYYWVPIARVNKEVLSNYPANFSGPNDILIAIEKLVDLEVLASKVLESGSIGYGVNQKSMTLTLFAGELGIDL